MMIMMPFAIMMVRNSSANGSGDGSCIGDDNGNNGAVGSGVGDDDDGNVDFFIFSR